MTEGQVRNLDRWGYPYVFDDFRFHMTLTGPIDADRRTAILTLLRARFAAISSGPLPIAQLMLLRQDPQSGRFRALDQAELTTAGSAP